MKNKVYDEVIRLGFKETGETLYGIEGTPQTVNAAVTVTGKVIKYDGSWKMWWNLQKTKIRNWL